MNLSALLAGVLLIVLSFSSTIVFAQPPAKLPKLVVITPSTPSAPRVPTETFAVWVQQFKQEAHAAGISQVTLDSAFANVFEDAKVVRLDRAQPEDTVTFTKYLANTVPQSLINQGRALYAKHKTVLDKVSARYGVPAQYIVALWGVESSFGGYTGGFSTINSLATLAYEGRRADFFKAELLKALRIVESQNIPASTLKGSWAGAMGHCQFMPSTYEKYAVDFDGDGKKDIWNSLPDMFASIANYMSQIGWNKSEGWGQKVSVPQGFDFALEGLTGFKPMSAWKAMEVTNADGGALPAGDTQTAIIYANRTSADEGMYLITMNYHVILDWNKSRFFATSVGTLADKIAQQGI